MNTARSAITTLAPAGVLKAKEMTIPAQKLPTAITAEQIITERKLLNTLIAERAGKIIRLEMSSAPIILIPTTTVTAVSMASSVL